MATNAAFRNINAHTPGFTSAGESLFATHSAVLLPPITSTQLDGKNPTFTYIIK